MVRSTLALAATAFPFPFPFFALRGVKESETGTAMIRERSNPKPLHNFTLPPLDRGSQIQMRSVKSLDRLRLGLKEDEDCDGMKALDLQMKTDMIKEELSKNGEEDERAAAGKLKVRWEEEVAAEMRPWNLGSRLATCKTQAGKNGSPARKEGSAAVEMKALPEKVKEREKFSVALKRKEIEDDWPLVSSAAKEAAAPCAETV